jgi:hypothetical protein
MMVMKEVSKTFRVLILGISIAFLTSQIVSSAYGQGNNSAVYSKDSTPFGVPYKDWITRWWQWNVGIPTSQHPRDNYTTEKCTVNQNGSVWFIPDILTGKEERTCTIPEGKAILVPLLTGECDTSESPSGSDADLRQCSTAGDEYGAISATLDGQKIENLDSYRTATDFFNISMVKNNIFDIPAGTYRGVADGFFVFLKPLSVGNHQLQIKTSVTNPTTPSYNYASEGTYNLKISPKPQTENNITNESSSLNSNITNKSSLNNTLPEQLPPEAINGSKVPKI